MNKKGGHPLVTDESIERLLKSLMEDVHLARRANRVAAIVADTCREKVEVVFLERDEKYVPAEVVQLMLEGVLAALSGKTDWSDLQVIHPEVTPLAYARIQAILDGPRLVG